MQLKQSNVDNKMQIDAAFEKCNVRVSFFIYLILFNQL